MQIQTVQFRAVMANLLIFKFQKFFFMKTIISILFACSSFIYSYSQSGTLDKNFGDTGVIINKQFTGSADAIGQLSNGKIIQVGLAYDNTTYLALTAYNSDGSIDETFGDNGATYYKQLYEAKALSIDKNDNIFIVSQIADKATVLKFGGNGILDSAFGNNGNATVNLYNTVVTTGIAIQPDEKIVTCGYIINAPNEPRQGFLTRYMPDGSLDESFGDKGIRILNSIGGPKGLVSLNAIVLQSDEKIVVATNNLKPYVYRVNSDGSTDKSFGNNGEAFFQGRFVPNSIALQTDGKIVGAGYSGNNMGAARLNADGGIDSSFGNNGIVQVLFDKDYTNATKVLLQADNKIILSGSAHDEYTTYLYFALTRLKTDGSADSSFGENGQTKTIVEGTAACKDALLQRDGKIVLGGDTFIGDFTGKNYFVLARYNNDESRRQILITKIKKWIQHHNGFTWDANNNISNYVIQRSYDGMHFSSITRINAGNNSDYTYQDPSPLNGTNYYRLQTTSANGAVNYSNVIAVTNSEIKISPNPATNSLHIEGLSNQKVQLSIVDFSGHVKLQTVVNGSIYNLNVTSLKAGNYLLKIETKDDVVTKSFVKE
jgi:uncharacterized delta-60 repeat protein